MSAYWTLTRRELGVYFISMTGYVVISVVTLLVGINVVYLLDAIGTEPFPVPITELFFSNLLFWVVLMLVMPIITMRLFALEKSSGTLETLMTTPVTDLQVVAAKFTAALVFYMITWMPSLLALIIVSRFTDQSGSLDLSSVVVMYLGIFLIGCLYVSFGCFASSVTRSQMIAAMISLGFGFGLIVLIMLASQGRNSEWQTRILSYFDFGEQFRDFLRGVLDTRVWIFHGSLAFFFLFLTLRAVESRHWK